MEDSPKMIHAHVEKHNLVDIVVKYEHIDRDDFDDKEFKKNKQRLKDDGHYQCYICGTTENLQVHHYICEWSDEPSVDFELMKEVCEQYDIYGYGKLLKNKPITSSSDVRNLMTLCQPHHTGGKTDGVVNGVHFLPYGSWILQKIHKDGMNPVPNDTQELNKELTKAQHIVKEGE